MSLSFFTHLTHLTRSLSPVSQTFLMWAHFSPSPPPSAQTTTLAHLDYSGVLLSGFQPTVCLQPGLHHAGIISFPKHVYLKHFSDSPGLRVESHSRTCLQNYTCSSPACYSNLIFRHCPPHCILHFWKQDAIAPSLRSGLTHVLPYPRNTAYLPQAPWSADCFLLVS